MNEHLREALSVWIQRLIAFGVVIFAIRACQTGQFDPIVQGALGFVDAITEELESIPNPIEEFQEVTQ